MREAWIDIDDIMWSLNGRVCERLGIDIRKVLDFNIYKNELLSVCEKENMIHLYKDFNTFRDMEFYDGIEDILILEEYGIHPKIVSNAFTVAIANEKIEQVKAKIPGISDSQIDIRIIELNQDKTIEKGISFLVDDNPYNIIHSYAECNIMMKTPWNQSANGKEMVKDKSVSYVDDKDFNSIIKYMIGTERRVK